jgi:HD-GYP domain-containing protein (c-di-GMP phosphodiesterase class II)
MNDISVSKDRPINTCNDLPSKCTITDQKCIINPKHPSEEIAEILSVLVHLSLKDIPLKEQLQLILQHVFSISWLSLQSKGAVFLVGDDPGVLVMTAQCGLAAALLSICERVPFGHCLCGRAASLKEVQYAPCIDERHDISYPGIVPHGHYCIPIETEAGVLGVLNFYIEEGHARSEKEVEFLRAVSAVLGGIIEHLRIQEKLKDALATLRIALGRTIEVVASMVERRDPYTAGHQRRVANLARVIATEMGLPQEKIEGIRIAGSIHDLGKISIPADILSKPTKLSEIEFSLIKAHSQTGYEILKDVDSPWPLADIVYQHHERMNGSGYPRNLKGDNILIEARILAVADVVEAMATHRPYRPGLGIDEALNEIEKNRDIFYDKAVADACLRLFREKGYKLEGT